MMIQNIIYFAFRKSTLGQVLIAQNNIGICFIALGDRADELLKDLQSSFLGSHFVCNQSKLDLYLNKTIDFLKTPNFDLHFPLSLSGSDFQKKVWAAIQNIPRGTTLSYSGLAKIIGMPKSTRAVARACASNRIALAIPCHRVICSNGDISGYRWGIDRKKALLKLEKYIQI
mgnify:CR=1 FL=1